MRNGVLLGALALVGCVCAAWAAPGTVLPVPAARLTDRDASGDMMAFATTLGEDRQQITLIDPRTRVMSVYHVEPKSGEIVLKAVRNVTWDMQMTAFNGTSPLPQEIRSQLQQR
jgi:hypothetical protein